MVETRSGAAGQHDLLDRVLRPSVESGQRKCRPERIEARVVGDALDVDARCDRAVAQAVTRLIETEGDEKLYFVIESRSGMLPSRS